MNVTFEPNLWGEGKGDCFLFIYHYLQKTDIS